MPNIVNLLKEVGMTMSDVEAIGVSLGPGSFTGVRIGVVTAKMLAHVLGVPLAGVVTLDLLAHQFDYLPETLVCPLIRVRKGEVYTAVYRTHRGLMERLSEYTACPIDKVTDKIRSVQGSSNECARQGVVFCGDGLPESVDLLRHELGDELIETSEWLSYPKAGKLAQLAVRKIKAGEAESPMTLVPFYIRRSAAETRMERASD